MDDARDRFLDLNMFRGVGEDPVYHPPILADRPRDWPLDQWADAPRDLGYPDFARYHMTRLMGSDCHVVGIDKDLARCQIPKAELSNISLHEADCAALETLDVLEPVLAATHPLLFIDDAHVNTFNIMRWAVDNLLEPGDYFVVEDMIPYWHRYSPTLLVEYISAFRDVLTMGMMYVNASPQLDRGVFRRSSTKK